MKTSMRIVTGLGVMIFVSVAAWADLKSECLESGNKQACYMLGKAHLDGDGVPKDGKLAQMYLEYACEGKFEKACRLQEEISGKRVESVMPMIKSPKSHPTDMLRGVEGLLRADIDGDGREECVAWKKFSSTEMGDYYQILVVDDNGALLWQGPRRADEGDPLVFFSLDTGVSLPELLVDFDHDGYVELLAPMAQSDVSPTYYRKLRWVGDRFVPLLQNALMYDIGSDNHFIWRLVMGVGGTWVSKLSKSQNGEIIADVTQMRDYGGVDLGSVSLVFDKKGARVRRVVRPPAKVGNDTVTSPFESIR